MAIIALIITVPAFFILLTGSYFSMHDDQHIARLYLLDQAIRQGNIFPRWVGGLGFGFGYPLFNFYPPLIYYIAELFRLVGFSYIWSIKLMIIAGFLLAAIGSYWFIRTLLGRWPAILGAVVYTYFFYHAVNVYVRGALAEFFAMAVLPFVFLFLHRLYQKTNLPRSIAFGISFTVLILTHPLIALPAILFIGCTFTFYVILESRQRRDDRISKDAIASLQHDTRIKFISHFIIGVVVGLSLSAFFWLPSLAEKQYTLTDQILTTELADYRKHFVCPYQFWYSPWGYGGSGENCESGMTFQPGKIPIALSLMSFVIVMFVIARNAVTKQSDSIKDGDRLLRFARNDISTYFFYLFLLFFSLFIATEHSAFLWQIIPGLTYLQWPWRFMTFTALFISVICGYTVYFAKKLIDNVGNRHAYSLPIIPITTIIVIIITVVKYYPYFRPQQIIRTTDAERTSFREIAWRVSGTSYEFVPKGVKTKKTALGTTTLALTENELPRLPYQIISGHTTVNPEKDNFTQKVFNVTAATPSLFRLNTYNFPGWEAYIDNKKTAISDNNDFKLITISVPAGNHQLSFVFRDTPVRKAANAITIITAVSLLMALITHLKKYILPPSASLTTVKRGSS